MRLDGLVLSAILRAVGRLVFVVCHLIPMPPYLYASIPLCLHVSILHASMPPCLQAHVLACCCETTATRISICHHILVSLPPQHQDRSRVYPCLDLPLFFLILMHPSYCQDILKRDRTPAWFFKASHLFQSHITTKHSCPKTPSHLHSIHKHGFSYSIQSSSLAIGKEPQCSSPENFRLCHQRFC